MTHPRVSRVVASVAALLVTAACANMQTKPEPEPKKFDAATQATINNKLANAAENVDQNLQELARIQRARTKPADDPVEKKRLPKELKREATVNWVGPAKPVVKEIAGNIGYTFTTAGDAAPTPIQVEVSQKDTPVVRILEDIGNQVMPSATVVVDPRGQEIVFRYDNVSQNGDMTRGGYTQ